MLMTSVLLFLAMREIWRWSLLTAGAVAAAFIVMDTAFLLANLTKIEEGGYVPLALAAAVYFIMAVWHTGAAAVDARLHAAAVPIRQFMKKLEEERIARVPGTAVFLTRTQTGAPPVMVWHVKHNRALHKHLLVLTVRTQSVPRIRRPDRLAVEEVAPSFWRAVADYGFMERPDIPALLKLAGQRGCKIDLEDVTYYLGHETVVPREDRGGKPRWLEALFAFLQRNSAHATDYFRLPSDRVVEIGRQVAI